MVLPRVDNRPEYRARGQFLRHAIHASQGLSTGDLEEAHIKRALMNSAAETIVLASREKIGAASKYQIATLDSLSELITDSSLPKDLKKALEKAGVKISTV